MDLHITSLKYCRALRVTVGTVESVYRAVQLGSRRVLLLTLDDDSMAMRAVTRKGRCRAGRGGTKEEGWSCNGGISQGDFPVASSPTAHQKADR